LQVRTRDPVDPVAEAEADPNDEAAAVADAAPAAKDQNCPGCALNSFLEISKAKCPAASSPHRYEQKACMAQKCNGNERCVEDQDIIFAIDGSASLSESGFEALRGFAVGLVDRYQSPSQVGVLQFGNGDLVDGKISAAVKVADISAGGGSAVANTRLLSGLPNVAQALTLAESMFKSGRPGSQKSLLVFTNSKPLYKHQAFEQAAKLRQQGVRIFVVTASDSLKSGPLWEKADDAAMVAGMASRPVEANVFHIEALTGPQADPLSQVPAVLARACRKAEAQE